MPPLLYSTNVFLKFLIEQRFRNDVHYAWCTEYFDSETESKYSMRSLSAPSSSPGDIYRQLEADVNTKRES
jgi:hypothetical protein